ncbi:MAG: Lsr2 family protein, partial [Microbacterium sp.]|nr:Lsr2 family protein [Microbacterium sp.]
STRRPSTAGASRPRRRTGQQDYSAVRAWAKENGYTLSDRGRVPAAVLEACEAAH